MLSTLAKGARHASFSRRLVVRGARVHQPRQWARFLSTGEKHGFKAETSKLLDIVTNSIYTDKEIFLRELVSNAADALEKFRHVSTKGDAVQDGDRTLEINITLDKDNGTITLEDSGVGMTKAEMMENLGTIARSGSKAFVQSEENADQEVARNVIGQFGVGFYSSFMVGSQVQVYSVSALTGEDGQAPVGHVWTSQGIDDFTIDEAPDFKGPGTKIVITLKDDQKDEYLNKDKVTGIVKRYSNYVGFPVKVDGSQANEVSAIWARDKSSVSEQEYEDFFKFISGSFDGPLYQQHFKTDVPIDMKALLFVPKMHMEKMGLGRLKPGVSLYSRKVLLEQNSEKLLPDWMRFVRGVVDSDDLPISLSRETMQDSRLMANISKALTKRVLKLLKDEAKKNPEEYAEKFYSEFGGFVKEGIVSDYANQPDIAKLLRFSSSAVEADKLISLDEYISRCPPEQKQIYYLLSASRKNAQESPYFEVFKERGIECLFLFNNVDDFVMTNLGTYGGRQLVNAASSAVDLGENPKSKDDKEEKGKEDDGEKLSEEEVGDLVDWMSTELKGTAQKITTTDRLFGSPAIVLPSESVAMRRMMKNVNHQINGADLDELEPQHLQVNPKHPMIIQMFGMRNKDPSLAREYAEVLYRSAVLAAGLTDDPAEIVPQLHKVMEKLAKYNP